MFYYLTVIQLEHCAIAIYNDVCIASRWRTEALWARVNLYNGEAVSSSLVVGSRETATDITAPPAQLPGIEDKEQLVTMIGMGLDLCQRWAM